MPDSSGKPIDYPRDEILAMAKKAVAGRKAEVYFKFTCLHCGQRCTLAEPGKLFESGECSRCGRITTITKAGFMLVLDIDSKAGTAPIADLIQDTIQQEVASADLDPDQN